MSAAVSEPSSIGVGDRNTLREKKEEKTSEVGKDVARGGRQSLEIRKQNEQQRGQGGWDCLRGKHAKVVKRRGMKTNLREKKPGASRVTCVALVFLFFVDDVSIVKTGD